MLQLEGEKELGRYVLKALDRILLETNWILLRRTKHGDWYDPQSGEVFTEKDI